MNTKMKVLSLIVGTAFAGSAAAVCPTSPVPPWTALNVLGGTAAIADGGLVGTECRLDSAINVGGSVTSIAAVTDESPAAEPRYRAQFVINVDSLTAPGTNSTVGVFSAVGTGDGIRMFIVPSFGGGWLVNYFVPNATTGVPATAAAPLVAGDNHVEIDLEVGASGSITLWVNNSDEGNATVPAVAVDNSANVGIETANLGLNSPSSGFVTQYGGTAVGFDQFDSRRTTFIGF